MLKKLIILVITVNFVFMLGSVLNTSNIKIGDLVKADTEIGWGANALMPEILEISGVLKEVDSDGNILWNSNPGSLDFGDLVEVVNETTGEFYCMAGSKSYVAVMAAASSGRPYVITKKGGDSISSGADILPANTTIMVPDYQGQDVLGGAPQGQSLGTVGAPAPIPGNHVVFTSGAQGLSRLVRAFLALGPASKDPLTSYSKGRDGATKYPGGNDQLYVGTADGKVAPITKDQRQGTYTGHVTFEVTLN